MSLTVKIHDAQVTILRELLFHPSASFAQMQKPTGLDSNHFNFHIGKLAELGMVEKIAPSNGTEKAAYRLTTAGKEYANTLDTASNTVERQPKISVIIIGWRTRAGTNQTEFLVQQRLKNPYYGYWARLGGKIRWGETVLEAAARELHEETGLAADLEYKGLYHKMDYKAGTNEMLEDKFFLLVKAENFRGDFTEAFEGGKNAWLTSEEIDQQEKVFQGMRETYGFVSETGYTFTEHKLHYDPADY